MKDKAENSSTKESTLNKLLRLCREGEKVIFISRYEMRTDNLRSYCTIVSKQLATKISCLKVGMDSVIIVGKIDVDTQFYVDFLNFKFKYNLAYTKEEMLLRINAYIDN